MGVGFNTFKKKVDNTKFVIKNITDRQIKIFTIKIKPGDSYDLMNIPFVSEADIETSLLKGELRSALEFGNIWITYSTISLVQYGDEFITFIRNHSDSTVSEQTYDYLYSDEITNLNEVKVFSINDLPSPVNGIITLDSANTIYYIFGIVNIGNNYILVTKPNISFIGRNPRVDIITGSVSGPLIKSTRGILLNGLSVINPDGYGIDLDGAGTDHILIDLFGILFSKYVGTISNALVLHANSFMVKGCDEGLHLLSSDYVSFYDYSASLNNVPGASCFKVPPNQTFNNILFENAMIKTQNSQYGINIDASTTLTNRGVFDGNIIYGTGTALSGITKKTTKYWFTNNSGIFDSQVIGGMGFSGNSGNTTISVQGTFVNIGTGTTSPPHLSFTEDSASERVSVQGVFPNQYLRYDGYMSRQAVISVALSINTTGGVEKIAGARLLINGNPVVGSDFRCISAGAGSVSYSITAMLNNGDAISMQVTNNSDTTALNIYSARLTVKV